MKSMCVRLSAALCAALFMLLSPSALASDKADHAEERALRAYLDRLAAELVSRGDARSLALGSVINDNRATRSSFDGKSFVFDEKIDGASTASELRKSAMALAKDDVLVYILLLSGTSESGRQSRLEASGRWAELEPDNLAPALEARGDTGVLQATPAEYARMDVHYVQQLRWIAGAILASPPTAAEAKALYRGEADTAEKFATSLATSLWATTLMPFIEIVRACKGAALDVEPGRRERCRTIADVMSAKSDTLLGRAIGLVMLANVVAEEEKPLVAERRRQHDWQLKQWSLVSAEKGKKNSDEFLGLINDPRNSSEIDVMHVMLSEAGISPNPPEDWVAEPLRP